MSDVPCSGSAPRGFHLHPFGASVYRARPHRPIHDALMARVADFGDFEVAPKKAYVSLRRKKQFATLGPATKTRFEVGLNMKGVPATERLLALPPGGMCQYKVNLTEPSEVDAELVAWIRVAFEASA